MGNIMQVVLIVGLLLTLLPSASCAAKVILLKDNFPGSSVELYNKLRGGITRDEYDVSEVDASNLSSVLDQETASNSILVLPNALYFPIQARSSLMSFLKRGNHLIAVSGPAFKEMVVAKDGRWLDQSQTRYELAQTEGLAVLSLSDEYIKKWQRNAGTPTNKTTYSVEAPGDSRVPGEALHASISKLDDWETFVSPPLSGPFPYEHTAAAFWAKGGPDTPELVVEWREKDGSRWMAAVALTTEWKRHALTPEDFRFWGDGSPAGRGKPGDQFNPQNAQSVSFGLASGISRQRMNIPHEFWIAGLQAVKDPYKDIDFTSPLLESISPVYKTYNATAQALRLLPWDETVHIQTAVAAPIPRSPATGSDALRKWRFIPVSQALDSNGEVRGSAAHIFLNTSGDYAGSIWGYVGLDQAFLAEHSDKALQIVSYILDRMREGIFIASAGTEHVAYTEGEEIKCGAYLVNLGSRKLDYVDTMFQVFKGGKILASDYVRTELSPNSKPVFIDGSDAIRDKVTSGPGVYTMKVWTSVRGKVVDEVDHEFRVVKYQPVSERNTVTTQGNDFRLDDKKWYPLGINYWPRYATGLEHGDYWLHWLAPEQYNTEIIEQDLALAQKLGMNLVSIQYNKVDQARPLMDFMERAEQHGIKVNIYIPGLHPLDQNFRLADDLITSAHLAQAKALFAYDVGWEVHIGKYDQRKSFDKTWHAWVIERYGSIESAQRDWGYRPDIVDGVITGPRDEQLLNDGNWRVYVAAYRRFWDDELSKRYMAVRNNIKSVDPNHLIGARSGYGGTGFLWNVPDFAFDLRSGVKHLDFTSPEAYGLGGDKAGFLKGGLNTLYGRFVSGGKPVYWAEYGMSIWPQCNAELLEEERSYYESILDMTYQSNANGSAGWWWPGGFRLGENSDFGIINPDGTPRPAALEIQKFASKFTISRDIPQPNFLLTIDRDKYVTGYPGIFTARFGEYVDALQKGKIPGLRTEGTETTSVDTPLVAVGNVPCNGHNPPKYLNAEFNYVKINGVLVSEGDTITLEKGRPISVEVSVGNTGDATWLPSHGSQTGAVALLLLTQGSTTDQTLESNSTAWLETRSKSENFEFLTKEVLYLSDAVLKTVNISENASRLSMRMAAYGRVEFGEVFDVNLRYK